MLKNKALVNAAISLKILRNSLFGNIRNRKSAFLQLGLRNFEGTQIAREHNNTLRSQNALYQTQQRKVITLNIPGAPH